MEGKILDISFMGNYLEKFLLHVSVFLKLIAFQLAEI